MRTMLTQSVAVLMPFNVQELNAVGGNYYGINQISKNINVGNRKGLINGNGFIFGVPGSGKSFFAKQEMGNVFLNTQDDVIVIDPMNEYFDIADTFGGAIVNLSAYTKNYVNPLDADLAHMNERGIRDVIADKSEFMLTLSYAEIKAVATGNPLIKEKMEVDNEVQRLKMLKASYDSQHYSLQDQFMIKFPKLIAAANEKLNCVHADIKKRDEQVLAADEEFAIKVGNMTFHERVDGGTAVLAAVSKCKVGETTGIGEYRGFEVQVEKNFIGVNYLILHGRTDYKVELSNSPVGCMVKLENCFNGMDGNIEFLEKKLEQYQRDMEQAKAEYEKPFAYEEELKSKTARQFELNTQLDLENKPITEENGQEISQVAENAYPYGERKDYR